MSTPMSPTFVTRLRPHCLQSTIQKCVCPGHISFRSASSSSPSSTSSSPPSAQQPLYEKLFGGNSASKAKARQTRQARPSPISPQKALNRRETQEQRPSSSGLGDDLRAWLENASLQETGVASRRETNPAVIVLQNAPRSLIESDFYRLAHQGKHVDGWAAGITKVMQLRSPITGEPQGLYLIFFESHTAAEAYSDKLHSQHRRAAEIMSPYRASPLQSASEPPKGHPQSNNLNAWTILPPTVPLICTVLTHEELIKTIHKATVVPPPPLSPAHNNPSKAGKGILTPRQLQHRTQLRQVANRIKPAKDDDDAAARGPEVYEVLVHLTGSKIPVETLAEAIRDDGIRRNLAWALATSSGGEEPPVDAITPLQAGSGIIKWGEKHMEEQQQQQQQAQGDSPTTGASRFMVRFAEAAEAKRFVRTWHLRQMVDERTGRDMLVHATELWS